jgi:hypothetical protein
MLYLPILTASNDRELRWSLHTPHSSNVVLLLCRRLLSSNAISNIDTIVAGGIGSVSIGFDLVLSVLSTVFDPGFFAPMFPAEIIGARPFLLSAGYVTHLTAPDNISAESTKA